MVIDVWVVLIEISNSHAKSCTPIFVWLFFGPRRSRCPKL